MLEGITCAACVWLIEQRASRLPGVLAIEINYATHRARVRWDTRQTRLALILSAIAALGYRACPYDSARAELTRRRERDRALWRLFVAAFGMFGRLEMYSVRLIDLHFWVSTIGVVLYISAMWIAGVMQGLMWRAVNSDGTLTYSFAEGVKATYPYYTVRLFGGLVFFCGMIDLPAVSPSARLLNKCRFLRSTAILNQCFIRWT